MTDLLRKMMLIRCFERSLMLQKPGFQLLSSGEEAVSVGVCRHLQQSDQLLSSGRSIGPALARGLAAREVMAELLGKATGVCKGQGGRGHLSQPKRGFFGAHAVVGGNLSVAVGVALAAKIRECGSVTIVMFGDSVCGCGALHESINLAKIWKLPLIFVCNNNQYSVSTHVREAVAFDSLPEFARGYGVEGVTVDGMDVKAVAAAAEVMIRETRINHAPCVMECHSYRFYSHSTQSGESRPADEIEKWRARCPIETLKRQLLDSGELDDTRLQELEDSVKAEVDDAMHFAKQSPMPDPEAGYQYV